MDPTETEDILLERAEGLGSSEGQHQNAFEQMLVSLLCSVCSSQTLTEAHQDHKILLEDPAQVSILLLACTENQLHPAPLVNTDPAHPNPSQGFIFPKVQSHLKAGDQKS